MLTIQSFALYYFFGSTVVCHLSGVGVVEREIYLFSLCRYFTENERFLDEQVAVSEL